MYSTFEEFFQAFESSPMTEPPVPCAPTREDRGGTSPAGQSEIQKERNRCAAKRSREQFKIKWLKISKRCETLEKENKMLKELLRKAEEGAGAREISLGSGDSPTREEDVPDAVPFESIDFSSAGF
eukprot:CAMPEP_0174887272 /NCGR_PEP_ID=MMETSP0167-20121228/2534_1 /TAXON_ID=38298 /ORGANISM="Rhodella maculata, Strain CCMP736" /LENGTH=125 /DNA_ID=CAMNT_0016123687 /DNA_START=84 /DNA_END=461 /DNA_ORIENTATION=-